MRYTLNNVFNRRSRTAFEERKSIVVRPIRTYYVKRAVKLPDGLNTAAPNPQLASGPELGKAPSRIQFWAPKAVFWAGVASLLAPTILDNFQQSWQSEQGEQGPIVVAIGVWLLWRRWPEMAGSGKVGSAVLATAAFSVCAFLYIFGRIADQFAIRTYAVYGLFVSGLYGLYGIRGLRRVAFPLAFLLFALPVPYAVTLAMTSHLRLWVTEAAVSTLRAVGLGAVRDGLDIYIDQYLISVREACSGMNSLFSLSAVGLAYVYLRRAPRWWYYILMLPPIVIFAVVGNFARVMTLVLMTRFLGDAAAQGVLHETAGMVTFIVALLGVFLVDAVASRLLRANEKTVII